MPPPFPGNPEFKSPQLDVYALGAVAFAVLFGYREHREFNKTVHGRNESFRGGKVYALFHKHFLSDMASFMNRMLGPAPSRPSIQEASAFFNNVRDD
jgi:hypothetical protein